MNDFISEKLSTRAKSALVSAQKICQELEHTELGTGHLLYGIISEISSFASEVLLKNRVSAEAVRLELIRSNQQRLADRKSGPTPLSQNLRSILEKAAIAAAQYQYQFIGTEHFMFGIVEDQSNRAQKILLNLKFDPKEIKKNLLSVFENVSKFPQGGPTQFLKQQKETEGQILTTPALDYFTVDLTQKAKTGQIDPVIGREKEVQRIVSILSRRNKNNPVLIGDPGVGKTAIVEGLALAIARRQVPDILLDKKILVLDLALIVAGSMFRGEFENRLKQIIDEVKALQNLILFIDELHTVVGAGAATGSLDAANILKPALARGELRAIGATTLSDYKKHIEQDPALERRFQPILVREPSPAETLKILQGLKGFYETHHKVGITDEALEAAVKFSTRYLTDRFLPDKALDLIDETAAFCKISQQPQGRQTSLQKIERDLSDLAEQKRTAVFVRDFALATSLKNREQKLLVSQQKISTAKSRAVRPQAIKAAQIAETVARMTGIPLGTILRKEAKQLLALEKNLKKHIIGQDQALNQVAAAIRRSRAGIGREDRPLGSFLFLGPTGVGKTETAKALARQVFADEQSLIRIDMSELMERHNVARLIGAPAGYIGYEEGGRLTEAIRRRPYSVVLFDEIEKAHPDVHNLLLQILEEGELTDAPGKKVNFRNAVIVMTSNIGLLSLNQWAKSFGFSESRKESSAPEAESIKNEVMRQVREGFRPEFLNRIDKIIVFAPLSAQGLKKIVRLELKKLQDKLEEQKIKLTAPPAVLHYLAEISFDPSQGARLVRKSIQDLIEDPLAEAMLGRKLKTRNQIRLSLAKSGKNKTILIR